MTNVDLSARTVDIRVTRNDAWSLQITLQAPDGTPINLTGKTIAAQLRDRPDSTDSTALTVTPVDLTLGKFNIGQAAATTHGVYDVQVTTTGAPRTYIKGRLDIAADVTRP